MNEITKNKSETVDAENNELSRLNQNLNDLKKF